MKPQRWQDWGNVFVGLWLVVSPWALGFADQRTAALVAWVLGTALVVFSGVGAYIQDPRKEAINVVLGLLLMGAPWMLEFADQSTATANVALCGALVTAFAVLAWLRNPGLMKLKDMRHPSPGPR